MTIRVGIIGCSGYTAVEAIRWLLTHPKAQVFVATSRQADGSMIRDMHPELDSRLPIMVEDLSPEEVATRCDVAFCCLPHGASAGVVSRLLAAGCRVLDLSADFRLSTPQLYAKCYGDGHAEPSRLGSTPYGMPELFREQIAGAELVAVPGCYPTSAILPLAPLLKAEVIQPSNIIVDSKSGVSGAGRTPKLGNLYAEVNESCMAYGVGTHRHQPEIVDIIQRATGVSSNMVFTPHLVPMERGILSTIYVRPMEGVTANQLRECLAAYYADEKFVRVVPHLPATRFVTRTNYCDISVRENGEWLIILSAIDNLVKGASGAAIQCMNVMFGLDESLGLEA